MKTLFTIPILALLFAFAVPEQADARDGRRVIKKYSDGRRVTVVERNYRSPRYYRRGPVYYGRTYYRPAPYYVAPYYASPYYYNPGGVSLSFGF